MPYDVIVLRVGHSKELEGGKYDVTCTITLLKGKHNILVDTGSAWDSQFLTAALLDNGLTIDDIDYVVGTHGHSDHIGNLCLFTKATHIVSHDINKGNIYTIHPFDEDVPYALDEHVIIESTPGHTSQDITVYVMSNESSLGLVAVAGDLFESEECLSNEQLWLAQSQFPEIQYKSRMAVLKKADAIIPGHGPMFKTPLTYKDISEIALMISSVCPEDD